VIVRIQKKYYFSELKLFFGENKKLNLIVKEAKQRIIYSFSDNSSTFHTRTVQNDE